MGKSAGWRYFDEAHPLPKTRLVLEELLGESSEGP